MKKGTCRHFTGSVNKVCLKGIEYKSVMSPYDGYKAPCMLKYKGSTDCPHYEEPLDEEVRQDEARIQAFLEKLRMSGTFIKRLKKKYKGVSAKGVETCPVCKGKIAFSISSFNGHVWLMCQTPNCLSIIE